MCTLRESAGIAGLAIALAASPAVAAQRAAVSGTITVLDRANRAASDVDNAVVWLVPRNPRPRERPDTAVIYTENREFHPHVAVVVAGDAVTFPNNDGFNHNVFSLSEEDPFDLGLYGRRQARSASFPRPGVVRVYCNVHGTMSAFIVVVPDGLYARPSADARFTIEHVSPGRYTLRAWHERAAQIVDQAVTVPPGGLDGITVTLDASGFRPQEHLNKYGQPYRVTGRRY